MKRFLHYSLLVGVSCLAGAGALVLIAKSHSEAVASLLGVRATAETTVPPTQPVSPEASLDMSFSVLTDSLKSSQGFALDHYSLSYLITANQQLTGLLRTVTKTEANAAIRTAADAQLQQTEQTTTELLSLQKTLGHLHH